MVPAKNQDSQQINDESCYSRALKFLEYKNYSRKNLSKKLKEKGFDSEVIEQSIDKMVEKKILREDYYIESRVITLMRKGYHPIAISLRLSEEGYQIELETIGHIFDEYQIDTNQEALKLVRKKSLILNLTPFKLEDQDKYLKIEAKMIRYLLGKGYPMEEARDTFNQFVNDFKNQL